MDSSLTRAWYSRFYALRQQMEAEKGRMKEMVDNLQSAISLTYPAVTTTNCNQEKPEIRHILVEIKYFNDRLDITERWRDYSDKYIQKITNVMEHLSWFSRDIDHHETLTFRFKNIRVLRNKIINDDSFGLHFRDFKVDLLKMIESSAKILESGMKNKPPGKKDKDYEQRFWC